MAYYGADPGQILWAIPRFETVNLPLQIVQAHGAPAPAQDATLTGESQGPQAQQGHELRGHTNNGSETEVDRRTAGIKELLRQPASTPHASLVNHFKTYRAERRAVDPSTKQ